MTFLRNPIIQKKIFYFSKTLDNTQYVEYNIIRR